VLHNVPVNKKVRPASLVSTDCLWSIRAHVRLCACAVLRVRVVQEFEEDESLKTEADEELCVSLDDCLRMFAADELLEDGSP